MSEKSVMISIQHKYVEKICSKIKTIEVRKNRPKIETPFKCYIYCTIGNGVKGDYLVPSGIQCGKVIGHFTCDRIEDLRYMPKKYYGQPQGTYEEIVCVNSCLTVEEIKEYAKGKPEWRGANEKLKQYAERLKEQVKAKVDYYNDEVFDYSYNGIMEKDIDETLEEFLK